MRIISGSAKGRRLTALAGDATRPTTDRVKESIFNLLMPYVRGARVLDLFAGSGALGIEALSLGAVQAIFVDKSYQAIRVINKNLSVSGLADQALTYRLSWKHAIKQFQAENQLFDLIFLDPPYDFDNYVEIIETIALNGLLADDAVVLVEHDYKLSLPSDIGMLSLIKDNRYGDIGISIYQSGNKGG